MTAVDYRRAADLGSATVHEAAGRVGALRSDLLPAADTMRAAGPAFTVQCLDGDNLWLHRAIYAASMEHDVIAALVQLALAEVGKVEAAAVGHAHGVDRFSDPTAQGWLLKYELAPQ